MENYSPLRYPGGKSALYPIILNAIIRKSLYDCIYIEPFAGGASIGLSLLLEGAVKSIIINDADKAIYSFWRSILSSPEWFIQKIKDTPITIDEWKKQKEIFANSQKYSPEFGFATFFLNRTNRSGILSAGPIGGYKQEGNYKIDCRFNKDFLIEKIHKISKKRNCIRVYNQDISIFLKRYLPKNCDNVFVYFDPPYFEKGQRLYLNHFSQCDHQRLRDVVADTTFSWIMTYDDKQEIRDLYKDYRMQSFSINYSLSNKGKGSELMLFKDNICVPSPEVLKSLSKSVYFNL